MWSSRISPSCSTDAALLGRTDELGHLFGLVNLTGLGGFHEDENSPGHAASEDSVMHWAVESFSFIELFGGGPPSEFNEADREEMRLIRDQLPPEVPCSSPRVTCAGGNESQPHHLV